jgi:hypothetical protein
VAGPHTIGVVLAVRGGWARDRRCLAGVHFGPTGARGTGEIGIAGAAAAIADVVFQATGRRIRSVPVTIDRPDGKAARPASGSRSLAARRVLAPGPAQQAGERSAFRGIGIPGASGSARVVAAPTLIGWLPLVPLGGKLAARASTRRGIIKPAIPAAPAGRRRASPGLRT